VHYANGQDHDHGSVGEVLFKNVSALAVSQRYDPLEVRLASPEEVTAFSRLLNFDVAAESDERKLYVLDSTDSLGYVLAGAVYWFDDPDGAIEQERGCH
jgi:hypothetical protein